MANIIDYVQWRGDIPFHQVPPGEVDALILSYLAYMPYDGLVGEEFCGEGVLLRNAALTLAARSEQEGMSLAYSVKDDRRLLRQLAQSERFGGIHIVGYTNQVDRTLEKQFSAVTFLLENGTAFIAYRGTDNTVVGWKEDFNMSFENEVPSQRDAVAYARRAAQVLPGPLLIGGHSKGGNLAVYTGIFAEDLMRERMNRVYNFDGPGFNETISASPVFKQVDTRIQTFVTHSSMVGILLWHNEPFTIVQSDGMGIFQHNPYTWQVMGGQFVRLSARTTNSHFADETIKRWLGALEPKMREQVIDSIYAVLNVSQGQNVRDLFTGRNMVAVLKAAGAMDEQSRKALEEAFRLLGNSLIEGVPQWIDRTADEIRQRVTGEKLSENEKQLEDGKKIS